MVPQLCISERVSYLIFVKIDKNRLYAWKKAIVPCDVDDTEVGICHVPIAGKEVGKKMA